MTEKDAHKIIKKQSREMMVQFYGVQLFKELVDFKISFIAEKAVPLPRNEHTE